MGYQPTLKMGFCTSVKRVKGIVLNLVLDNGTKFQPVGWLRYAAGIVLNLVLPSCNLIVALDKERFHGYCKV
jgi:hypothetical protein